jgi:hypothetical protein
MWFGLIPGPKTNSVSFRFCPKFDSVTFRFAVWSQSFGPPAPPHSPTFTYGGKMKLIKKMYKKKKNCHVKLFIIFQFRCAFFTPNRTWSLNYSVRVQMLNHLKWLLRNFRDIQTRGICPNNGLLLFKTQLILPLFERLIN